MGKKDTGIMGLLQRLLQTAVQKQTLRQIQRKRHTVCTVSEILSIIFTSPVTVATVHSVLLSHKFTADRFCLTALQYY